MISMANCIYCGKKFVKKSSTHTFCSVKCRLLYAADHVDNLPVKEEKTCPVCGKIFSSPFRGQIFCSYTCRYKFNLENLRQKHIAKPIVKKICKWCGKEFTPVNNAQKYCSRLCLRQRFKPTYRICKCCGTKFLATSDSQIYCSDECKLIMREDDTPVVKSPAEKSNLDKLVDEADACGLSYGNYKAQLAMGKTFEELKVLHDVQKRSDDL